MGDRVAIVGNIPALGEWDSSKAIFLETNAQDFPSWSTQINVPRNITIEYKYIIVQFSQTMNIQDKAMNPHQQQLSMADYATQPLSIIWETIEGHHQNRRVNTTSKKSIFLYEEINRKKVIEEYVEETNVAKNEYSLDYHHNLGGASQHPYIH